MYKRQVGDIASAVMAAWNSGTGQAVLDALFYMLNSIWKLKMCIRDSIVPIPEAVLDDSDYDIWSQVRPRLQEAFGKVIDAAILYGTDKPTSWREGLVPSATTANAVVTATSDIFKDIMGEGGVIAKVEESGYIPNGVMAAIQMRAKLRGLVDKNGQPIFKTDMQGDTRYALDGMSMYFPVNGAFDPEESLAIVGDWSQLVYAIRQDMTFKIFDSGVVQMCIRDRDGLLLLEGWARDGLTDEQIAHNMGITAKTLYEWKNAHSEICEALKKGKEVVDYQVENALLASALDGNTTAQIFWLKNRRPDLSLIHI